MRKDSDFDVTDRIAVVVATTGKLAEIISANREEIMGSVLALELTVAEAAENAVEWNINGEKAMISVKVVG